MRGARTIIAAGAVLVLLAPGVAQAAGVFDNIVLSPRVRALGGAFVALSDDATALFTNVNFVPSTLTRPPPLVGGSLLADKDARFGPCPTVFSETVLLVRVRLPLLKIPPPLASPLAASFLETWL